MPTHIMVILNVFSSHFSRRAAFVWFVVVIFGFLLRFDHHGVSSFIRWLGIAPSLYPSLLHFFRAESWQLGELMKQWMCWSVTHYPLVQLRGRVLCLGDGIKLPKEAERQPGLSQLHQNSGNQGKVKRFLGHHFGCLAFVAVKADKAFAVPQVAELHEGVNYLRRLAGETITDQSLVARMVTLAVIAAMSTQTPLYLCLDAFFATATAFQIAAQYRMPDGQPWVHLVIKAKRNYVAYRSPQRRPSEKIKLWDLFSHGALFSTMAHPTQAGREVLLYAQNGYWGTVGLVRFVWVIDGRHQFILMASDLTLSALEILGAYALRSKIEVTFLMLKHLLGGFAYRFWAKNWPRAQTNTAAAAGAPLRPATAARADHGLQVLRAIERYVNLALIALGILQYLALHATETVWRIHTATSWLRTYSASIPSEEVVQRALQVSGFVTFPAAGYAWIQQRIASSGWRQPLPAKVPPDATSPSFLLS